MMNQELKTPSEPEKLEAAPSGPVRLPEVHSSPPPGALRREFKKLFPVLRDVWIEVWTGKPASEVRARREKRTVAGPS